MKNIDKSNISLRVVYIFESILAMVVLIVFFGNDRCPKNDMDCIYR